MPRITCPNCYCRFDPANHPVMPGANQVGALTGAVIGSRVGMVAGPLAGVAGAVVGGVLAESWFNKVTKCPCCDEIITKP